VAKWAQAQSKNSYDFQQIAMFKNGTCSKKFYEDEKNSSVEASILVKL
jgi:hypothetical protein